MNQVFRDGTSLASKSQIFLAKNMETIKIVAGIVLVMALYVLLMYFESKTSKSIDLETFSDGTRIEVTRRIIQIKQKDGKTCYVYRGGDSSPTCVD